jgi:DNA polymerase-3 subunit gamma/tau
MSYTVLARRYRSTTFDEVIGQEHVAQTLKKAIASDRVAHAYLFTGTRGVGKTSMARILAKALNCQKYDKPTPTPCNKCDSCERIAKGDDMDVIEIDAASNTGVDNVRDIIENAQYRPSRSRFKVYIIDEVHMLSKAAFNALLKTMEEPPEHVKFILATTEVEKVLPTILSRCQRYDFRNIPTREIAGHLKEIVKQEKIAADDDALLLVAKAGAGSMRDALSLLDRLLSIGEKKLTADLIEHMLGLPRSQQLFDLAQAIGDGDVKSALTRATAMINAGQSVDGLIAALTDHLRNLLILRTCGADSELVEVPGMSLNDLVAQSERFDPAALVQDVAILEELRRHVRQSQAGRALFDATIVRMALADQFAAIGQLVARLDGAPAPSTPAVRSSTAAPARPAIPAQKKNGTDVDAFASPTAATAPSPDPVSSTLSAAPAAAATRSASESLASSRQTQTAAPQKSVLDDIDFGDDDLPRPGKVWDNDGPSLSEMVKAQSDAGSAATATESPPAAAIDTDLSAAWSTAIETFKGQAGVYGVVSQSRLSAIEDNVAVIRIPASCETFAKMWERNGKKDLIRAALSETLGRAIGVRFEVDADPAAETPAPAASPAAAGAPTSPPRNSGGPPRPAPRPPPPPPAPVQRITQEQVDAVRAASPLVSELANRFNAQVVKIENE